jgi:hypothetical protein
VDGLRFARRNGGNMPNQAKFMMAAAVAIIAGILTVGAVAQGAGKAVPDAQVEANVLKALAGAPELAGQSITTTTVYGVVTLSGSVQNEALRTKAETLASRAAGVQKVVDELILGAGDNQAGTDRGAPQGSAVADAQATQPLLQSDGTMAPAGQQDPQYPQQAGTSQGGQGMGSGDPNAAPTQSAGNYPPGSYPAQGGPQYRQPYGSSYGPPPGYSGQSGYSNDRPQAQQQYGAQQAGATVTIPSGALIRIRINQSLDSDRTKSGASFDGIVVNDVVAGGEVAIPRGASVQGTVVSATKSGALAGRGELSLTLTQVTMGGKSFPVVSDIWAHNGGDKTTETINKTALGTGIGALFGAAAGGGEGAAIGAGIGGALGLGSSATSGRGQVYVPSEGMLTFHLAQQATVTTVGQAEMDRLAYGVPAGGGEQRQLRPRYPQPYYGPAYYRPYSPYPY